MSEFITIQVGQCGNQIGSALWPVILKEYTTNSKFSHNLFTQLPEGISSFFNINHTKNSQYQVKARAVCIDMEESVLNRLKTGDMRSYFDRKCFVSNYPGSGNNWAEGYCEHGPKYRDKILTAIQRAVEQSDSPHGFLVLFSTGGGTGSGLGSYVLQLLADYYKDIERFVSIVYPTGTEDVITCPYNMLLSTNKILEHSTCVFPVENRALLDITTRQRRHVTLGKDEIHTSLFKPFEDMNTIIVNMLLHLTSGSRFPGSLNFDMNEINTNMVPFPKMNYLTSGFQHISQNKSLINENHNGVFSCRSLKDQLFVASCDRSNQLLKIDPLGANSTLLAATFIGRGQFTLTDMRNYTGKLQARAKFNQWSKKSMKSGLCNVAPCNTDMAFYSLFNTTGMKGLFQYIHEQFGRLYRRKAHIHHYTAMQNFDEAYFDISGEAVQCVIENYREIEDMHPVNIPRLFPT